MYSAHQAPTRQPGVLEPSMGREKRGIERRGKERVSRGEERGRESWEREIMNRWQTGRGGRKDEGIGGTGWYHFYLI